jgi:phosphopantothenoylcysteine decarboxylase/phosphopantothenate--cysteine ligase
MANGTCDNLLLAVYLSSKCAVVIAPAMDEDMWLHPATKQNIEVLKKQGNEFLAVNNGELASGLTGEGRMMEPEKIMDFLEDYFSKDTSLKGINALVTAGPTYEAIDPVRFIGNHSSGKMGAAIAEELFKRGANVQLVIGPSDIQISSGINTKKVVSADEMYEACMQQFDSYDIIIMAAAVADFTPKKKAVEKIKKSGEGITLELVRTKDILLKSGQSKTKNQTVVGFALETNNEKANAIEKLKAKNADMIILNSLKDERAGFGYDTNKITIFDKNNKEYQFPAKTKKQVATDIVNTITQYRNE